MLNMGFGKQLFYSKDGFVGNLKIKTSALNEPSRRYRNFLNHKKRVAVEGESECTINDLERELEREDGESFLEYFNRWKNLHEKLSLFYNSYTVWQTNNFRPRNDASIIRVL